MNHLLIEVDPKTLKPEVWEESKLPPLLRKMQQGGKMDVPFIGADTHEGRIYFTDGIHRTAAAITLGFEWIWVRIDPESFSKVRKYARIRLRGVIRTDEYQSYLIKRDFVDDEAAQEYIKSFTQPHKQDYSILKYPSDMSLEQMLRTYNLLYMEAT